VAGQASSATSNTTIAPASKGVKVVDDFHQGAGSITRNGETESTLKSSTFPSSTRAASRSLPPTCCQTKGSTSRHFIGSPCRSRSAGTSRPPSASAVTCNWERKPRALKKFDACPRELM
jgi:hypothetical protein